MNDSAPERAWDNRRSKLVCVALVSVVVIVIAVLSRGDKSLTVPAPGEVSAQWLEGHPIFVVADSDGSIRVLDAISPHSYAGFTKVLAWCASSKLFEDLWHGSRFDRTGMYLGGPAPTGLASYEIESVAGGEVRVGRKGVAPARPRPGGDQTVLRGEPCDQRTAMYGTQGHPGDEAVLDDLVVHVEAEGGRGLWIPTRERVLGTVPTHPCSEVPAGTPAGVCSDTP